MYGHGHCCRWRTMAMIVMHPRLAASGTTHVHHVNVVPSTTATATTTAVAVKRKAFSNTSSSEKVNMKKKRSPYTILKLKTSASVSDIKTAFRTLAKKNHPDLNPHVPSHISQANMSEIITAYNQLMEDDFYGRVGDGRVALACELFTLDELKMDRIHDVYRIRVNYEYENEAESEECGEGAKNDGGGGDMNMNSNTNSSSNDFIISKKINVHQNELSNEYEIEINVHPDDSISDIKRQLQSVYFQEWGLEGRRLDRDKLSTGWEIVCKDRQSEKTDDDAIEVMSYHLFLHSYGIVHGDIIHAIVRKYD